VTLDVDPRLVPQLKGDVADRVADENNVDIAFPDKKDKNQGRITITGPKQDAERAREDLLRIADDCVGYLFVSNRPTCSLVVSTLVSGSNGPGSSLGSAAARARYLFGSRPWCFELNLVGQDNVLYKYPNFNFSCNSFFVVFMIVTVNGLVCLRKTQMYVAKLPSCTNDYHADVLLTINVRLSGVSACRWS
jgi:hypothetical protein